jgi:NADP-dependent 3-hydroxy acid dehydrogenase YdfG
MQTILITGASKGIGKSIALLFAHKGWQVILTARSENNLAMLAQEIRTLGGKAAYFACDVAEEQQVNYVFKESFKLFGHIDVLVNNAGIGVFKSVEQTTVAEWEMVMNVNVKGTFLCTKAVLPAMTQQKGGHIIMIASDVSKRIFANGSLYCASKFAQDAFAAALRKEVRPLGIRVTTIYPGMTDTYFAGSTQGESRKKDWLKGEDIAEAVWYAVHVPKNMVVDELMLHPTIQDY